MGKPLFPTMKYYVSYKEIKERGFFIVASPKFKDEFQKKACKTEQNML